MMDRQTKRERERETQSLSDLSVNQWVRSDIHASQQQTFPIVETSATVLCGTGISRILWLDMIDIFGLDLWPLHG